jgi:hypothetical protein
MGELTGQLGPKIRHFQELSLLSEEPVSLSNAYGVRTTKMTHLRVMLKLSRQTTARITQYRGAMV